jgi:tRNA-guanine family transglycosylase
MGRLDLTSPSPSSFPPWTPIEGFRFELLHHSRKPGSRARVGRIHTPHGVIDTPGFVPVGTNAALKGVSNAQAAQCGVQLMFCNTYHLLVHPGPEIVQSAGGLHGFMDRPGPLITDSGGFQVFSLAHSTSEDGPELKRRSADRGRNEGTLLSVSERGVVRGGAQLSQPLSPFLSSPSLPPSLSLIHTYISPSLPLSLHLSLSLALSLWTTRGAAAAERRVDRAARVLQRFRSYLDGSSLTLTPESSVLAQKALGADIIVPLDELPPLNVTPERLAASVALSHRWMARSLRTHLDDRRAYASRHAQAMYGIIHGGVDLSLRRHSASYLGALPFDGYAVGGSRGTAHMGPPSPCPLHHPVLPRGRWVARLARTASSASSCFPMSCPCCRPTSPRTHRVALQCHPCERAMPARPFDM